MDCRTPMFEKTHPAHLPTGSGPSPDPCHRPAPQGGKVLELGRAFVKTVRHFRPRLNSRLQALADTRFQPRVDSTRLQGCFTVVADGAGFLSFKEKHCPLADVRDGQSASAFGPGRQHHSGRALRQPQEHRQAAPGMFWIFSVWRPSLRKCPGPDSPVRPWLKSAAESASSSQAAEHLRPTSFTKAAAPSPSNPASSPPPHPSEGVWQCGYSSALNFMGNH